MKVNMNQMPDKKPTPSKIKPGKKSSAPASAPTAENPSSGGNVYKEALNGYKDKFKAQMKDGGIFRKNKFWIVTAVILFLIFISVNSNMSNAKTQLTVQIKRAKAETEELNAAIAEVKADLEEQARIDSIKLTQEEEELARNNAIEQGTLVATLQNAYRYLDLTEDYEAFTNNKNSLDICFGDNDKNARTEWYSSISGIPGTWEFASKASFTGNTAKVLWLCYADEDRTLLAYCTAKYNADTKLFTNVEWKMTGYASAHISSDDDSNTSTEQITSVQDALKQLAEESGISTDGEFDEDTINTNNELSNTRDSYKESVKNGDVEGEEYDNNYDVGLPNSSSSEE